MRTTMKGVGRRKGLAGLVEAILLMICLIVFCGSTADLLLYSEDKIEAETEFHEIRENARDLSELYEQNHDLIGWVRIEGTRIDYPVVQTPDHPEYYLNRDFSKEYSESGTPFLDARSAAVSKYRPVTWNWLIYGHNMKIGTMFHDLLRYNAQDYWEKHRFLMFDVYDPDAGITDHGEYEIFAAARSKIQTKDSDAFSYYRYAGYTDAKSFHEYAEGVRNESLYDTGIVPRFGEQLVTLSTCAYHTSGGRFYIVARRIN